MTDANSMPDSALPPRGALSATAANTIANRSAGTPKSSTKRLVASVFTGCPLCKGSTVVGFLQRRDVRFLLLQHFREGALRLGGFVVAEHFRHDLRHDLPGESV